MQTTDCRTAVEQLLAYWENPDEHPNDLDAAIRHIGQCPHCESRMGYLVRALAVDEEDSLTCQDCQDLLPDYMRAETEGRAQEERWRAVAFHLQTCPHCSAEYAALSDLLALAHGERGEEPSRYPVPDLSFLRIPWRLDELGRLIVALSAELLRALRPPTPWPAYATVRAKSPRTLYRLPLIGAVEDLDVTIEIEEARDDPTFCTVTVKADIPSRGGWPNLSDTEVTLKRDERELDKQLTDAYGEAVFGAVATADLAHLVFEIAPRT